MYFDLATMVGIPPEEIALATRLGRKIRNLRAGTPPATALPLHRKRLRAVMSQFQRTETKVIFVLSKLSDSSGEYVHRVDDFRPNTKTWNSIEYWTDRP